MNFETPLCEIGYRYGTDKCPQINHAYTPFYHKLLKGKRRSIKTVVELGIGTRATMGRRAVPHYVTGASLFMWRDYFPNAHIYGADFMANALIQEERISTFFCDEREAKDLKNLVDSVGTPIDLFVDDANHAGCRQVFACRNLMPLLPKNVIYVIEDVHYPRLVSKELIEYGYVCEVVTFSGRKCDNLIVVGQP